MNQSTDLNTIMDQPTDLNAITDQPTVLNTIMDEPTDMKWRLRPGSYAWLEEGHTTFEEWEAIEVEEEMIDLNWVKKLPAEIRNRIYEIMTTEKDFDFSYAYCSPQELAVRFLKDNKSRVGIVVLDQLDTLVEIMLQEIEDRMKSWHTFDGGYEGWLKRDKTTDPDWFDAVREFSSPGKRRVWYRTAIRDSYYHWKMKKLLKSTDPCFRAELEHYIYNNRVYDLSTPFLTVYNPHDWLENLKWKIKDEDIKFYEHVAFDYVSRSFIEEYGPDLRHEDHDENAWSYIQDHRDDYDLEKDFLALCRGVSSELNPKTITIWMRFSEDEIIEILEGKETRDAWVSAIQDLRVRNNFIINLFILRNERTPETPKAYAEMCMTYANRLRKHLMPYTLREDVETAAE